MPGVSSDVLTSPSTIRGVPATRSQRPISGANPGLKICSYFIYLTSHTLLTVTFCDIITVSQSKGLIVLCKLKLHVLGRANLA